ncbi:hypothetical protein N9462_00245 [Flavobacteriaceae bacterium]|nr:hypothetical protein [Flavobacteriaceae bacterium]
MLSITPKTIHYFSEKPLDKNTLNSFKNNYGIHEITHKEWANNYQLEEFKIIFPKTTNHIKGPISHIIIDSSARAYPRILNQSSSKIPNSLQAGFTLPKR